MIVRPFALLILLVLASTQPFVCTSFAAQPPAIAPSPLRAEPVDDEKTDDESVDADASDADPPLTEPKEDEADTAADKPADKTPAKKVDEGPAPSKVAPSEPAIALDKAKPSDDDDDESTDAAPAISSEYYLPASTRAWVSVPDAQQLEANFFNSQMGQLGEQEALRPFLESLQTQLKDILAKNDVKFGLEFDSLHELETGEICVAGILPQLEGQQPNRGAHGIVLLVDVSPDPKMAAIVLEDAAESMIKRGGTREKITINDSEVTRWTIPANVAESQPLRKSLVTIVNNRIVASDNEKIFRDVLRRVAKPGEPADADSLAQLDSFSAIAAATTAEGVDANIRWFVDPFGYARLAEVLAAETEAVRQVKNRPLDVLSKQGLDAIKAIGGIISLSTGKHEVFYRSLIYAPQDESTRQQQKRVFGLLNFTDMPGKTDFPPSFIPADTSSYFTATWDLQKAFDNIGHFIDAFTEEGTWEGILRKMKEEPRFKVDLRRMVQQFDNRITIYSTTIEPIVFDSEKVVLAIKLNDGIDDAQADWLLESVARARQAKVKVLAGFKMVEDDPSAVIEEDPDDFGDFDLDDLDFEDEEEFDEPEQQDFTMFSRRFFAIKKSKPNNGGGPEEAYLIVANDKDFLKTILLSKPTDGFEKSGDYMRLQETLAAVTDSERIRFRQFGRLDRILKTNYEMLRRGEMGKAQTVFARVVNRLMTDEGAIPDESRDQEIDASDLPSDYEAEIAPYLGPSGWVMEMQDNGWRFTGCVLSKMAEVKK